MRRIALAVWTAGLVVASVVLLGGATWPGTEDPAPAVMAIVRAGTGLLAAHLALATVAAAIAALSPSAVAVRVARAVTTASLRRAVALVIGGGLVVPPAAAVAEPRPRPPVEAPVLHRVRDAPPPAPVPARAPRPVTVVVQPGDHVWRIAERVVAARLGRPPTDAEVAPYWLAVVEVNRPQLPDPDLVFPGQELALPS